MADSFALLFVDIAEANLENPGPWRKQHGQPAERRRLHKFYRRFICPLKRVMWKASERSEWCGRIFCVRQVYFTTSCQQVWGRVNQPFILFIHHIWGETVPRGAVFIIQTSDRMQYFTILQYKLHSLNIQDDQSTCGLLAKPLKKFPKSPIRLASSHFWQTPKSTVKIMINRVIRFNIINSLLCLFFI